MSDTKQEEGPLEGDSYALQLVIEERRAFLLCVCCDVFLCGNMAGCLARALYYRRLLRLYALFSLVHRAMEGEKRCWVRAAARVANSNAFGGGIIFAIICNCVLLALEVPLRSMAFVLTRSLARAWLGNFPPRRLHSCPARRPPLVRRARCPARTRCGGGRPFGSGRATSRSR